MKRKESISIILLLIILVAMTGCSNNMSKTTIYLQEVSSYAPINKPLTRVIENRRDHPIEFHYQFSVNGSSQYSTHMDGHTFVNNEGIFEVEELPNEIYDLEHPDINIYPYEGNNLKWNVPDIFSIFDIDVLISKNLTANIGCDYSAVGDKDIFGANFGIGIFSETPSIGWRFDMQSSIREVHSDAKFVKVVDIIDQDANEVYFKEDSFSDAFFGFSYGFSLNTKMRNLPANFLFGIRYGRQTLFDYDFDDNPLQFTQNLEYSSDMYKRISFFSVTLGAFRNIAENLRLVGGMTYSNYNDAKNRINPVDFFFQFDFLIAEEEF